MVTKVLSDILELVANAMNLLVSTILGKMDLSLDTMRSNVSGLDTFYKVMLIIGVAVVFFCIIAEAISLITSPFSGQAKQGGLTILLRCLFAGMAVVFIFPLSEQVIGNDTVGVQAFYKEVVSMTKYEEASPERRKEAARELKDMGYTPEQVDIAYATYQKERKKYEKANQTAYVKKLDESNKNLKKAYRLVYKIRNANWKTTDINIMEDLDAQIQSATDGAGALFWESAIPFYGLPAAAASLYITAVIIILLVRFVQLILSLLMRYVTFGLMVYMGPMCVGFAASPMTAQIAKTWIRTVISQIILFMTISWGVSVMYRSLMEMHYDMSIFDLVIRVAFVLVFGKVILKMDEVLNRLGFNTMPTLDNARSGIMGAVAMGMMAFRTFKGGGGGGGSAEKTSAAKTSGIKMNKDGSLTAGQGRWRSASNEVKDRMGLKKSQNQANKALDAKYNKNLKTGEAMSGKDFKELSGIEDGKKYGIPDNAAVIPDDKGSMIVPLEKNGDIATGEYAAQITPMENPDLGSNPAGQQQGVTGNERMSGPNEEWDYVRDSSGNLVSAPIENVPEGANAYLLQRRPVSNVSSRETSNLLSSSYGGADISQSQFASDYGASLTKATNGHYSFMNNGTANYDSAYGGYHVWLESAPDSKGVSHRSEWYAETNGSYSKNDYRTDAYIDLDNGMRLHQKK